MKPLKICMVTTFYPPYNFGGDGIFVERLANALAKDGQDVHVVHDPDTFAFCAGGSGRTPLAHERGRSDERITLHALGDGRFSKGDLIAVHQLGRPISKARRLKALLAQGFDVVHFHNISLLGGPAILKYGSGIKLCTLHDHWFVCPTHVLWRFDREACTKRSCLSCTVAAGRPPQLWRYSGAVADAVRYIDAFIAPSAFARKSHLDNGFPAEIRVLPHFIPDNERDSYSRSADDRSPHQRPYFLSVGRLEKIKGVQFLIEQFRNYQKADLLIAGTGNYEQELASAAQGLSHVHLLGRVEPEHLKILYRHAIATIVPSLCYETFGLVPLEGFAVGTPAIVHNLGALPEVVLGGGGLVYSTGDELLAALERLRTGPSLRDDLSRAATDNLLSNYTEQRHLRSYYDMIAALSRSKSVEEVR